MAHEISVVNGRAEAAFAGTRAWHGLGELVTERMTPGTALEKAGLNWEVKKVPLAWAGGKAPDAVGIVRADTNDYFGTVGKDFTPIQNVAQAAFIADLVGEGGLAIECVGALRQGRRTFWTVKIPGSVTLQTHAGEDRIEKYLIVANGHDGSLAFRAFWSPVRVVCANTLRAALDGTRSGVTLRHTKGVKGRLEEAHKVLGLASKYYENLAVRFQGLVDAAMNSQQFSDFTKRLVPVGATEDEEDRQAETRLALLGNWRNGVGVDLAGSNRWRAYNAVTEFASHQKAARGKDALARSERRFESLMFGAGKELSERAFELLTA